MKDQTENIRKEIITEVNSQITSENPEIERKRLAEKYGQVWNTAEVANDFEIEGFMAPFIIAKNKKTGKRGSLMFQHCPRFYFCWQEDSR